LAWVATDPAANPCVATLSDPRPAPRVLAIDLGELAHAGVARVRPWECREAWLGHIGNWGGGALGVAELVSRELAGAPAPLALCVGSLVRRGYPTAARASVASRAPLTGLFSEGLVGGSLARRLASLADGVFVAGRVEGAGEVLVVDANGSAKLERHADLAGASPREVHRLLEERLGPCGTLSIGLAGERGVALASLASGGEVPHFVGRGGLGAVLGRCGLKAIAVCAPEVAEMGSAELVARLARSPRLLARAEGGTLELFDAFAQRGDVAGSATELARLGEQARAARAGRHGCRGCPTPCGWEFDTRRGAAQSARFGASHALAAALRFSSLDDALELLRACDELGLDAKELGATMALVAPRDLDQALRWVRELCDGVGEGARLARGSVALARELGIETPSAKGAAVRPDASIASLLGQCVSSRGGDPMRTFPFLAVDGADLAAFRASTGIALPAQASDPSSPVGKGRLVAWHEDWANALDMLGFCAFSGAALLADGLFTPAELSRELAPRPFAESGLDLLDAGGVLSALQRALNERYGAAPGSDGPSWSAGRALVAEAWSEYAWVRGLDPHSGRLTSERRAALEAVRPWRRESVSDGLGRTEVRTEAQAEPRRRGRVTLRARGGELRTLELDLPATAGEVLAALGRSEPRWGSARPAIFREGVALSHDALVRADDELTLLAVLAGG
jgi:aldehyde:ferredoxin oxidoreductase